MNRCEARFEPAAACAWDFPRARARVRGDGARERARMDAMCLWGDVDVAREGERGERGDERARSERARGLGLDVETRERGLCDDGSVEWCAWARVEE